MSDGARRGLSLGAALKWRAIEALAAAVAIAPRACLRLAPAAGDLVRLLAVTRRRTVTANVRTILPQAAPAEVDRVVCGIFRSVARYYVELLTLPRRTAEAIEAGIVVNGYAHFRDALDAGRGVIVASGHLGPAELVLQGFAARGVDYTAMVERVRPPQLSQLLRRVRTAHGHRYVDPDLAGTKALIRTLRAGGVVAVLVDRDVLGTGIEAEFLGATVKAPPGAVELARLTGAAIVPAFAAWRDDGRSEATLLPAIHPHYPARDAAALRAEVEGLLRLIEPAFRNRPDQWLLLQRFAAPGPGRSRAPRYTESCDA